MARTLRANRKWVGPFRLRDLLANVHKELHTITRPVIDQISDAKQALGHSNATVNRMLELVRAILRKCVNDWEWLDRVPTVRMLR
jgi:hypothetical protein